MVIRRRPLLRAAALGGGAYAAGRGMGRRAEERDQAQHEQNERISALEQHQAPRAPDPQPPGTAATSPMLDQLSQLSDLHQQGILTEAEFAAAKAKLLGT